ncbi:hypothetical protein MWU75_07100 [Ornithinimicrobium sp. F0845]|uniref:hypothetical protein n=1 Tax=Ornithinimicrobium sp. F0845 TaxID=2926412 RepID=UPI001FF548AD|nr:hypothetical protein [Ornithinimicrobium sp. F0845]MCK0111901.1 hypothetical protein [Ornithinimicrobium sp. F0845]
MVHKPAWFTDDQVFVSYAPTVGINKDGEELFVVDEATGQRTDVIDDKLLDDVRSLETGVATETGRWVDKDALTDRLMAVPAYFDARPLAAFDELMRRPEMSGFNSMTIEELIDKGWVNALAGHGSPSADLRRGDIPYIKVSDIRAGQININPTNRVSQVVAERFWRGEDSGLQAWDLITPIRTSKNIGEFAVLMPGQERIVLTKEMLVLRATEDAPFDTFYLLWAMTLKAVRRQWERIVFMQTNREDVGTRYREIIIPVPANEAQALASSAPFRDFYQGMDRLRDELVTYLQTDDKHHIFISTAALVTEDAELDED